MHHQELSKITEEDTVHFEGMAAVAAAKDTIIEAFNKVITLLHCTANFADEFILALRHRLEQMSQGQAG